MATHPSLRRREKQAQRRSAGASDEVSSTFFPRAGFPAQPASPERNSRLPFDVGNNGPLGDHNTLFSAATALPEPVPAVMSILASSRSAALSLTDHDLQRPATASCAGVGGTRIARATDVARTSAQRRRWAGPAQPEEVAPAYVFFASNADSSYITGHVLPLLGGGTIAGCFFVEPDSVDPPRVRMEAADRSRGPLYSEDFTWPSVKRANRRHRRSSSPRREIGFGAGSAAWR